MKRDHQTKIAQLVRAGWQFEPQRLAAILRRAHGMTGDRGQLTAVSRPRGAFGGVAKLLNARVKQELLVRDFLATVKAFGDVGACAELLWQLARIFEQHGDSLRACEAMEIAFDLLPHDERIVAELERLGRQVGRWSAVGDSLRARLEAASTADQRRELLWTLAELQLAKLDQPAAAAARLEQLLTIEAGDLPALEKLAICYRQLGDTRALLACLERTIHYVQEPARLVELHEQIAQIYVTSLVDEQRALERYELIVELDPRHEGARCALAGLYEGRLRLADAVNMLKRALRLSLPPQRRAAIHHQLGKLYAERLFEPTKAREQFEAALAADPDWAPARSALAELTAVANESFDEHRSTPDTGLSDGTDGGLDAPRQHSANVCRPPTGADEAETDTVLDSGAVSRLVRMVKPIQAALERLASHLARGHYRRRANRAVLHPSGTELEIDSTAGPAHVRMAYEQLGYSVEIIVYPPGDDLAKASAATLGVWARLRRLITGRSAQQRADRVWAEGLLVAAGTTKIDAVRRSPSRLLLRLRCQRVPTVDQLEGWLRAAQQRLSSASAATA